MEKSNACPCTEDNKMKLKSTNVLLALVLVTVLGACQQLRTGNNETQPSTPAQQNTDNNIKRDTSNNGQNNADQQRDASNNDRDDTDQRRDASGQNREDKQKESSNQDNDDRNTTPQPSPKSR